MNTCFAVTEHNDKTLDTTLGMELKEKKNTRFNDTVHNDQTLDTTLGMELISILHECLSLRHALAPR